MLGNIFNQYFLGNFIDNYRKGLIEKVDQLEITESTDLINLIKNLKKAFTINPIDIKDSQPSQPIETYQDSQDMFGRTYKKKIFKIQVCIPFEGNKDLFFCYPSSSQIIWIDESVRIHNSDISATIVLDDLNSEKYQQAISRILSDLKSNISSINNGIKPWNDNLENQIKQLLEQRKNVVAKKFDFMEKIGLKINPKSNKYITPSLITKKTIPNPVSETINNISKEKIPTLQEEVYKDIKDVLYNVGKAIERKPSLYLDKHEEDLRDIFLLFLETRYESTSGVGEAFNKKGKTDILLKYAKDGTNLFVAECKFWNGQKKFLGAIDQLLSYLTHRDSKTALMIFVEQNELTAVSETIKNEVKKHMSYKRFIKDNYETSFSYEFRLPTDSQKAIQMEIMLFHFPKQQKNNSILNV